MPTPDYTDISLDTYFQIASIYRSRGCTNRCKFCAEWKLFGRWFRVRSVEKVVKDIEIIIEKHKPQYMIFGESLINDNLQYFACLEGWKKGRYGFEGCGEYRLIRTLFSLDGILEFYTLITLINLKIA